MNSAIGYIRVSTGKQAEHGVSLDAQRERIAAYAKLHGFDLVEILEDASSAKSVDGRPAMQKLLRLARAGGVDAVICVKLDRMFRNTVESITIIPELQALGVATHIMDLGGVALDTSSPMGAFFLTIAAAFADMERRQIGERTKAALQHKRAAGKQYSATPPFGWTYAEGQLVESTPEQHTLYRIGYLARMESLGPTAIAERLGQEGYLTRHNRQVWHASTVTRILRNPLAQEKFDAWAESFIEFKNGDHADDSSSACRPLSSSDSGASRDATKH